MNIPAEIRKWLVLGVVVVVLCFALAVLTMCNARKEAATARAEQNRGEVQAGVGKAASDAENRQRLEEKAGADVTQRNADKINEADNAKDDAGEAGRRGWIAYCERQRVLGRNLPARCAGL